MYPNLSFIGTWIAYVHIATSHGTDYPNFFWIHTNTSKLSTHWSNVIIVQSPIRSYKNQNYYWRELNEKWTKNNSAEEHLKRSNGKIFVESIKTYTVVVKNNNYSIVNRNDHAYLHRMFSRCSRLKHRCRLLRWKLIFIKKCKFKFLWEMKIK